MDINKNEKWYVLLSDTENDNRSIERVSDMNENPTRFALNYTLKTLDIFDKIKENLNKEDQFLVETTLKWSETAKGCSPAVRKFFHKHLVNFNQHNIASAELYKYYSLSHNKAVYYMIRSHGLIGQSIRGEMLFSNCYEMKNVMEILNYSVYEAHKLFMILNECIIRAVSDELWISLQSEISKRIYEILKDDIHEYSIEERYQKINPLTIRMNKILYERCQKIFTKDLWYPQVVLSEFPDNIISEFLELLIENENFDICTDISFERFSKKLFYEYDGHKQVNIYMKRIIEYYFKHGSNEHISINFEKEYDTLLVDFQLSKSCEKLIDFCIEAERSGVLSYQKAITTIFDLFGFRRDELDRLNNEDSYLKTMNEGNSTKSEIVKYIVGKSVLDVGSGGGMMLNLLEKEHPDMKIIGTDISENVIEMLNNKKRNEGHNWDLKVHNFVNGSTSQKYDNIIFSSILHEIYSYTEWNGNRFQIESVKTALKNAYESLNPGGRMIIRDGVKTDSKENVYLYPGENPELFKDVKNVFNNYFHDFHGLTEIDRNYIKCFEEGIYGNVNFLREFAYTYTWGTESYSHEVNEQFGYFTLSEYIEFAKELGGIIVKADEYLEDGYPKHLKDKLIFKDNYGNEFYPNSTCFLVIERPVV